MPSRRASSAEASHRRSLPAGLAPAGGVAAVALLVALVLLAVNQLKPNDHTASRHGGTPQAAAKAITGPDEAPFELRYPRGWRQASPPTAQDDPTPPQVVLQSPDGRGVVTLNVRGPLKAPLDDLSLQLTASLAERFADFRLVSSKPLDIPAGRALYTSWVLEESQQVQGSLVVEVGDRSYMLDAAIVAGSTQAAREVGAIFNSFDVKPAA